MQRWLGAWKVPCRLASRCLVVKLFMGRQGPAETFLTLTRQHETAAIQTTRLSAALVQRASKGLGAPPARLAPGQDLVLGAAGAAGLVARVVVLQRARALVHAQRLQRSA